MWTAITIPLGLALAVVLSDVLTLGLSDWIYTHTANGGRVHRWAGDIEDLAKTLLPQFVEIGALLVLIAALTYAVA